MLQEIEIISETYILTSGGILLVQQVVQCLNCMSKGVVYLNMSIVENDKVNNVLCPTCNEEALRVITYDLYNPNLDESEY